MLGHQLFRRQVEQLLNDFDTGLFDWNYDRSERDRDRDDMNLLNDPFFLTEKPHPKRQRQQQLQLQQQQQQQQQDEKTDEKITSCKTDSCKTDTCKHDTDTCKHDNKNKNNNDEDTKMSVSFPLSLSLPLQTIKLDVVEKEKEYAINADIPGVNKEDVKLSVSDDVLTICGERKEEQKTENKNFKRIERSRGILSRSIRLPRDVQQTKISASQDNGVLTIILPKSDIAKEEQKIIIK